MRLTALPSRRGSSTTRISTDEAFTDISDSRSSGPFGCRDSAADTRNPYDLAVREDDWPTSATRASDVRVGEEAFHTTCRPPLVRPHSVARAPRSHRETAVGRQIACPGARARCGIAVTRLVRGVWSLRHSVSQ